MTTPAPIFARTTRSYAPRPPYLTATEYKQAATGVDSNNLVPNGSSADQAAALAAILLRASAWVDTVCQGNPLAATLDVDAGRFRVQRDGRVLVPLRYFPIVAVAGVQVGQRPGDAAALADLSGCDLDEDGNVLAVPAYGSTGLTLPPLRASGYRFVQVDYVNGFPHTTITAAATAGDLTLPVASGLAIFPGQQLTIADAGQTETVTVAASWAPTVAAGPAALPLAAPLAADHAAGVAAGALPYQVTEAAILLATALIKTRGAEDFEMPSLGGQVSKRGQSAAEGLTEVEEALDLLAPFRRSR